MKTPTEDVVFVEVRILADGIVANIIYHLLIAHLDVELLDKEIFI